MCKHSTDTVDRLAKRQRGLDARGNDPMATKRKSSWAAGFIQDPPGDVLATTLGYLNSIPEQIGKKQITGATEFKQKLGGLGPTPTGLEFADFFANQDSRFKGMMDEVGNPLQDKFPELDAKAREQPFFKNRGRNKSPLPRERRLSMDSRHVGITTGADRTGDTKNVYSADRYHAKGAFLARLDDETVKKFQKSGAPFIAGASGTLQFIALEMENRKPFDQLEQAELQEREKVLTMMSVQHVAAGHHSMSECLLAAKVYGYFDDVPDPLIDYDASMKAFEKHIQGLGLGSDEPLSRASENEDKGGKQVKYRGSARLREDIPRAVRGSDPTRRTGENRRAHDQGSRSGRPREIRRCDRHAGEDGKHDPRPGEPDCGQCPRQQPRVAPGRIDRADGRQVQDREELEQRIQGGQGSAGCLRKVDEGAGRAQAGPRSGGAGLRVRCARSSRPSRRLRTPTRPSTERTRTRPTAGAPWMS